MPVNRPDPVRNLGHKASDATLTKPPVSKAPLSEGTKGGLRGPLGNAGVYSKFDNPTSGHDLAAWSDRASANSYAGKDPKRGAGSDNHLLSTKGWANLPDSGAESGPGR